MQSAIDGALAAASANMTKAGVVGSLGGWLASFKAAWLVPGTFFAAVSCAVAVLGLAGSLYFNVRRDKREQEEHEARMRELTR